MAQLIEFTVTVNSVTDTLNQLRMPGLLRTSEALENMLLEKMSDAQLDTLEKEDRANLEHQVETLLHALKQTFESSPQLETIEPSAFDSVWAKNCNIWIVSAREHDQIASALCNQLASFSVNAIRLSWQQTPQDKEPPLAILFIRDQTPDNIALDAIQQLRHQHPAAQFLYLGHELEIESVVQLMRSGIDANLTMDAPSFSIISRILDLMQQNMPQKTRVMIVEDSLTAITVIERALNAHGIETHAIRDPIHLFEALASFKPDLILMDMHMPRFNGIEATRVLRQMTAYSAIPIVYLSGESDVSMQVEALRLGGDQFLNKPVNPILLTAVIKTKIERAHEVMRASQIDGLTGLLNHTAAKSRLEALVQEAFHGQTLIVAMIDIDHFKSINDTYGHPVGDEVIRSLAWLLKGNLRPEDLIGRYGGEEFLLAMPGITPEQALFMLEKVRHAFAALAQTHADVHFHATFSAGFTSYLPADNGDSMTEAADQALLDAKRKGRNRVIYAANMQ